MTTKACLEDLIVILHANNVLSTHVKKRLIATLYRGQGGSS